MRPLAYTALAICLFGSAACASSTGVNSGRPSNGAQQQECAESDWLANLVGTPAAEAAEVAELSNIPYRAVGPGGAMTMDFNPKRLTILMDEHGIITDARCG